MHPILFRLPEWLPLLGGAPITSFGVAMFLSFLTAGVILKAEMERMDLEGEKAWDIIFWAVVGGIVGAKLYYVFLNYDRLQVEGLSFVFSRGGMVWYGGFILATALVVWEIRRSELPLGKTADAVAPAISLAYAVGRVGCFLVGDDYGRPTDLPWGMRFPEGSPPTTVDSIRRNFGVEVDPDLVARVGEVLPSGDVLVPVHPTQLYEVGMSLVIFFVIWKLRHHLHRAGWLFMLWLAFAGAERFVVEIFRVKDDRFFGPLTLAQMISLGLIVVGAWGLSRLWRSGAGEASAGAER